MVPSFKKIQVGFLVLFIFVFMSTPSQAQWSDDPAENTLIGNLPGEANQPKFVADEDGGGYVSWLGNPGGGYNVYLQRIDEDGNVLWGESGIVVADRSFSSTQQYGLCVDTDGNAVMAFRDDRFGGESVSAARVSPDGDLLWGEDGIALNDPGDSGFTPMITCTSDGSAVVAYFDLNGFTRLVSLDSDGDENWSVEASHSDSPIAISDIAAATGTDDDGSITVAFATTGPPTIPRKVYIEKYDADGNALWGGDEPVTVSETGSMQMGYFPGFTTDELGGVTVAWYVVTPDIQSYVQYYDADGNAQFDFGGITVSTNATQLRGDPTAMYDVDSESIFTFWRETDGSQNSIGVYGQRISIEGERLWGNSGSAIVPLSGQDHGQIRMLFMEDDPVLFFARRISPTETHYLGAKFDRDGEFVWDDEFVTFASSPSNKSRMLPVSTKSTEAFILWEDSRDATVNVYGQIFNSDGQLEAGGEADPDPDPTVQEVTFSVDMSIQNLMATYMPEIGDMVYVRGGFNDWSANEESQLSDQGEMIYSITLEIEGEADESFDYKFFIEAGDGRPLPNDGYEGEVGDGEFGNRILVLTGEDLELETVFFDNVEEFDTSAEDDSGIPTQVSLNQNYPNPFNPVTVISYELPESGSVTLEVFNALGQRVAVLADGHQAAGTHHVNFDAASLASGIYLYRLQAGTTILTRKMMFLK